MTRRSQSLCPLGLTALLALAATPAAAAPTEGPTEAPAADSVGFVVLRVNGTGSAASAQKYIDALMVTTARVNGWAAAHAKYFTATAPAETWIAAESPHYGILSLPAFLRLQSKHALGLLGTVDAAGAGGQQYFMISATAHDLAGCMGKTLASNIAGDAKFIDNVVAGDAFDLADFQLVDTRRPIKTLKSVISGENACALVDDAQIGELAGLEGGPQLSVVWFSRSLPAIVVTQFGTAPQAEASAFKSSLDKICEGDGKSACAAAGIETLRASPADALDSLLAEYRK